MGGWINGWMDKWMDGWMRANLVMLHEGPQFGDQLLVRVRQLLQTVQVVALFSSMLLLMLLLISCCCCCCCCCLPFLTSLFPSTHLSHQGSSINTYSSKQPPQPIQTTSQLTRDTPKPTTTTRPLKTHT